MSLQGFKDFPFAHTLTQRFIDLFPANNISEYDCPLLTGCRDVLKSDGTTELIFFKAGYNTDTIQRVKHEHDILTQLQHYDFIPKILYTQDIGRYHILFLKHINGVSLDHISYNDERWHKGISNALDIMHKLYSECGFVHKDMHPNNIIIDIDGKVHLIDFEFSYLSPNRIPDTSWVNDLGIFVNSLDNFDQDLIDKLEAFDEELSLIFGSMDPILYQAKITKFKQILFS